MCRSYINDVFCSPPPNLPPASRGVGFGSRVCSGAAGAEQNGGAACRRRRRRMAGPGRPHVSAGTGLLHALLCCVSPPVCPSTVRLSPLSALRKSCIEAALHGHAVTPAASLSSCPVHVLGAAHPFHPPSPSLLPRAAARHSFCPPPPLAAPRWASRNASAWAPRSAWAAAAACTWPPPCTAPPAPRPSPKPPAPARCTRAGASTTARASVHRCGSNRGCNLRVSAGGGGR